MATLKCLTVVLVLALAAPALAATPPPVTTCWTDGEWGTYVTRFRSDGQFLTVTGYLVYADGSFTAPLSGGGYRRPDGQATVILHYFAQGLSFDTVVNFYHHLAGGTAHLYYRHGYHAYYDPLPIWPTACPW